MSVKTHLQCNATSYVNEFVVSSNFQDNKFNTASDGNWRPEHVGAAAQRSSNWEDGLGRGDIEKNRKERKRLETKRDANERYHAQIAKDSLERQQKERARQDYHRLVQFFLCL